MYDIVVIYNGRGTEPSGRMKNETADKETMRKWVSALKPRLRKDIQRLAVYGNGRCREFFGVDSGRPGKVRDTVLCKDCGTYQEKGVEHRCFTPDLWGGSYKIVAL